MDISPPDLILDSHHRLPALQHDLVSKTDPEKFTANTVTQHLQDANPEQADTPYPSRHYVQPREGIDLDALKTLFARHDITPSTDTYLIHAGYTGEFAAALRTLGADIIFTDPIDHWVRNAKDNGFEAYTETLQECPGQLLTRVDGIATFEGYTPLESTETLRYEGLRILSRPTGLLFCESEHTRQQLKEPGKEFSLKRRFTPFDKAYDGINRHYRERDGLRLYHINADTTTQEEIRHDITVLAMVQELIDADTDMIITPSDIPACDHQITYQAIDYLADASPALLTPDNIRNSIHRLRTLTWESLGNFQRYTDPNVVDVANVRFAVPPP